MNMRKLIVCILVLTLTFLMFTTGCTKKVEDFGTQTCVYCGKEYSANGNNTYINADGELVFICPDCH